MDQLSSFFKKTQPSSPGTKPPPPTDAVDISDSPGRGTRMEAPVALDKDKPVTQQSVAGREMGELEEIMSDAVMLSSLTASALSDGNLEETSTLQRLSQLSGRLLLRNEARAAGLKYAESIRDPKRVDKGAGSIDEALKTVWVTYAKQSAHSREDGQTVFLSKLYLHGLRGGSGGPPLTACVRFTLAERDPEEDDPDREPEPLYDLELKVLQVHPFVKDAAKLSFAFGMQDTLAADAGSWRLDESQRSRLGELHDLLGHPLPFGTPASVLGFVLSLAGGGSLESHPFLAEAVRASRDAHRQELLADSGALF